MHISHATQNPLNKKKSRHIFTKKTSFDLVHISPRNVVLQHCGDMVSYFCCQVEIQIVKCEDILFVAVDASR